MKWRLTAAQASPRDGRRLALHLVCVLLIKAVILTALWHEFVKPYRVAIDTERMAQRLAHEPARAQEK